MKRPINRLIVHCAATPNGRPVTVADIDRWHRQRGYHRIGYHFVIYVDGSVHEGRPIAEPGAHAYGFNADSIGICMVGGVDANGAPSPAFAEVQFAALRDLLLKLRASWPEAAILGHRDLPNVAKACPSFDAGHWFSTGQVRP